MGMSLVRNSTRGFLVMRSLNCLNIALCNIENELQKRAFV